MPQQEPVLESRNLNKYFRNPQPFHVLKDVTLKVYPGEFVAVMGKSGSGKSTLLYALSTMDTQYEGEVYLAGQLLNGMSERKLANVRNASIGFIFQFHFLLQEFSVLRNVMLPGLKLKKKSPEAVEQDALEKLDLLGIKDQAHKPANQLSGGQQQRVAIARALINEPEILMGDEPTGNLDSRNTANVMSILRELSDELNHTIIAVTHDRDFAAQCDRTIWLKDGRVMDPDYDPDADD